MKSILISIGIGIIGIVYIAYGKKKNLFFALSGMALILLPYFIDGTTEILMYGAGLALAPFVLSRLF